MKERIYTILVGGKAGDGVKKLAQVITAASRKLHLYAFQMDDYQSLIRGGHSFSVVSISTQPVFNAYQKADLIICLDQLSYDKHIGDLLPEGEIYYNSDDKANSTGIGLPLTSLMKEAYEKPNNLSLAGLAIFCAHFGLSTDFMIELINTSYKKKVAENLAFADLVYPRVQNKATLPATDNDLDSYKILTGNQVIALGAWAAGLDTYFAYPMTPASSILHYYAANSEKLGIKAVHAESELAAANMAVGAIVTGARAGTGSSGGGFALMQEAFSMAGIVEAPLFCVLSSRPGPATGVSTYTAQEDLYFALHQGHGEFSRIVACPDSLDRAFSLASELLSLAWEFQIPVILLTEKHLSESAGMVHLNFDELQTTEPLLHDDASKYDRYAITESGISPMLFPPSEEVIKWNSHEHMESGLRTDLADKIVAMKDKRDKKTVRIIAACSRYEQVAEYGSGDKLIFAYGSTALEVREALKHLEDGYKLIVPIYFEPFPTAKLEQYRDSNALVIEHNSVARFAQLLDEKIGLKGSKHILRYDGRSFDPIELAQKIKEAFL